MFRRFVLSCSLIFVFSNTSSPWCVTGKLKPFETKRFKFCAAQFLKLKKPYALQNQKNIASSFHHYTWFCR